MLEHYYAREKELSQLRAIPGCELLDALAAHFHEAGYTRPYARGCICWGGRCLAWINDQGLTLGQVRETHFDEFLETTPRTTISCRTPSGIWPHIRSSINHLKKIFRAQFGSLKPESPSTPARQSLLAYEHHLRDVCGYAEGTIRERILFMEAFLVEAFGNGPLDIQGMEPALIPASVASQARGHQLHSASHLATAYRSYFRFLQFNGVAVGHLVAAIPSVRMPKGRLSGHPILSDEQIESLLGAFDHGTPKGQRDYAMVVCMLELGMRSSDVAALTFEDLDWRGQAIRVPNVKTRCPYRLPLPMRVGKAISDYLRGGRPDSVSRNVFLRHHTPVRPLCPRSVQSATHHAYLRAGLPETWHGCHILRRTAATRMHRRGVSMKEIADILGHRSIDTTAKYACVDVATLTDLPLPWPKEAE